MQTRLPALDKERSIRLWEEWGRAPRPAAVVKKYEQSAARAEPPAPAAPAVKATRKKTIARKR